MLLASQLEPYNAGSSALPPAAPSKWNPTRPALSASTGPEALTSNQIRVEWLKCALSPIYFTQTYGQIYNATLKEWIPFEMWPAQHQVLDDLKNNQFLIVLKARQLGISWLCLSYALWMMVFHPAPSVMLMSKRDEEAMDLLNNRLVEMYNRLPSWMQAKGIRAKNAHDFVLSNGSRAKAFPTSGGRSYTGTLILLDEADFLPDLNKVLNAIKPAVDAGGQLIMVSTVDKEQPMSAFKEIFRQSYYDKQGSYKSIFLPWWSRPERTTEWYEQVKVDMFKQTNTHDSLYQEYPANPEEALAPIQLNKRIPFDWISACRGNLRPIDVPGMPGVPNLAIYKKPVAGRRYIIGADPAEGNPTSDDSAGCVLDVESWEEVATFAGKWEPKVFANYIDLVGLYYNEAAVMAERNNHGHALILALQESGKLMLLKGHDNDKPGWLDNAKGKTLLYDFCADSLRDGSATVNDPITVDQLSSIEAASLAAPDGMHDDHADAFALCLVGCKYRYVSGEQSIIVEAEDPLQAYDTYRAW